MAETPAVAYRRLPGRSAWFRFGANNAPVSLLWLGPDHLLKIERTTSRETYKRFFYRDIQSVIVEESSRRVSLTIFNGAVLGVIVIMVVAISQFAAPSLTFAAILAAPFVVSLLVNLALGPTCEASIVTAVGTERLSSLGRLPRSIQVVNEIAAEVEKAQGSLQFAQLATRWPSPVPTPPVN